MFEPVPVVICSCPKPVPGSVRKGENAIPAALVIPGRANSFSVPPMPSGRWARFGDG
jgi:hypothetical protein